MQGSKPARGFSPRDLCSVAALTALSVIVAYLCKFLTITPTVRITFENLPIIMAGFVFGPAAGLFCGVTADFLSALIFYGLGAMNPFLTVASGVIGLTAGTAGRLTRKYKLPLRLVFAVFPAHVMGNMIIKTIGFRVWYGTPVLPTLAVRVPLYAAIAAVEYGMLLLLLRSDGIRRALGIKKEADGSDAEAGK